MLGCLSLSLAAESPNQVNIFGNVIPIENTKERTITPELVLSIIDDSLVDKFRRDLNISISDSALNKEWEKIKAAAGLDENMIKKGRVIAEATIDLLSVLRAKGKEEANRHYKSHYTKVLTADEWEFYRENDSPSVDLDRYRRSIAESVEDAFEKSKKSLSKDILRRDVMMALSQQDSEVVPRKAIEQVLQSTLGGDLQLALIRTACARQDPDDITCVYAAHIFWYAFILNGISTGSIQATSPVEISQITSEISSRIVTSFKVMEVRQPPKSPPTTNPIKPDSKTDY